MRERFFLLEITMKIANLSLRDLVFYSNIAIALIITPQYVLSQVNAPLDNSGAVLYEYEGNVFVADNVENLINMMHQKFNDLSDRGQFDQAISLAKEVLKIRENTVGKEHWKYASDLNNIGLLYLRKGDPETAEPILLNALDLMVKALGGNHIQVALLLDNLGLIYQRKEDLEKALPLQERALAIAENVLKPDDPQLSIFLVNLSGAYRLQGNYQKAEQLLLKALSIEQNTLGPNALEVAETFDALSILSGEMGNYDKAIAYKEKSMKIREAR